MWTTTSQRRVPTAAERSRRPSHRPSWPQRTRLRAGSGPPPPSQQGIWLRLRPGRSGLGGDCFQLAFPADGSLPSPRSAAKWFSEKDRNYFPPLKTPKEIKGNSPLLVCASGPASPWRPGGGPESDLPCWVNLGPTCPGPSQGAVGPTCPAALSPGVSPGPLATSHLTVLLPLLEAKSWARTMPALCEHPVPSSTA